MDQGVAGIRVSAHIRELVAQQAMDKVVEHCYV